MVPLAYMLLAVTVILGKIRRQRMTSCFSFSTLTVLISLAKNKTQPGPQFWTKVRAWCGGWRPNYGGIVIVVRIIDVILIVARDRSNGQ